MEMEECSLYMQLHKLSGVKSQEALDQVLSTLWTTRKTGLRSYQDKSHLQSLLNLPSISDLDPVCSSFPPPLPLSLSLCYANKFCLSFWLIFLVGFVFLIFLFNTLLCLDYKLCDKSLGSMHTQVLACLRTLIRKCVYENFTGDDLLKLFPPDLSIDLQSILLVLFQKYQSQWMEDASREQVTSLLNLILFTNCG